MRHSSLRTLAVAAALSMCAAYGSGPQAQTAAPTSGETYYLYDEQDGLFMSRGATWGTHALADRFGQHFTVTLADGTYTLAMPDNGTVSTTFYADGGNDNNPACKFTLVQSGAGFVLQNSADSKYWVVGADRLLASQDAQDGATVWQFKTETERNAILAAKTAAQKAGIATKAGMPADSDFDVYLAANYVARDVTSKLTNPELHANTNGWTWTGNAKRGGAPGFQNNCAEAFQNCGSLSQTVTVDEAGIYKVAVNGFSRFGSLAHCVGYANAGHAVSTMGLTAGDCYVQMKPWASDRVADDNPNSRAQARSAFDSGKYKNEVYCYVGTDRQLTVSIDIPSYTTASWNCFADVTLTHYTSDVTDDQATALLATVPGADVKMSAAVRSALTAAQAAFEAEGGKTVANYNALTAAIEDAAASAAHYAGLKAVLDRAGTFDAAGQAAFATAAASALTAYNDGTATDCATEIAAASAALASACKAQTTAGSDMTLAITGAACSSIDGWSASVTDGVTFHCNTWSTEGEKDGSGMTTPFIEDWLGSGNTLADNVLSHTPVTGLRKGVYKVSALVRVYNEAAPVDYTGVYLFANNERTLATTGTACTDYNGVYGTYSATVELAENEDLNVGIKIESANVNWVAFKNFTLEYEGAGLTAQQIADIQAEAAAAAQRKMSAADAAALAAALTAFNAEGAQTVANYNALRATLDQAEDCAAKYAHLADILAYPTQRTWSAVAYPAALATAQTGYDQGTLSAAEASTAAASILAAYRPYTKAIIAANAPTSFVTNGTFDSSISGWQTTMGSGKGNNANNSNATGGDFVPKTYENYYYNAPYAGRMYQQLTHVPDGEYFLAMTAAAGAKSNIYAGSATALCDPEGLEGTGYTVITPLVQPATDGTLEVGLNIVDNRWSVIDNVVLLKHSEIRHSAEGDYGTICLPFDATAEGADLFTVSAATTGYVTLTPVSGDIEGGKTYVYRATAATQTFTTKETGIASTPADGTTLKGTFSHIAKVQQGQYVVSGTKFYLVDSDVQLAAYRCALDIPAPAAGVKALRILIDGDDSATAIQSVSSESDNSASAETYDLSGRRISQPARGLYIRGGRKVYVK